MPPASPSPKRVSRTPAPHAQKSKNAQAVARFRDRRKIQLEQLTADNADLKAQIEQLQLDLQRTRQCLPNSTAPAHLAQVEFDNYLVRRENAHLRLLLEHCLLSHQGDLAQLEAAQIALSPADLPLTASISAPHQLPPPQPHALPAPHPTGPHDHAHPPGVALAPAHSHTHTHTHPIPVPIPIPTSHNCPTSAFAGTDLASMQSVPSRELALSVPGDGTPLSPGAMSQRSMSSVPTPPASAALPYCPSLAPTSDFSLAPQAGQPAMKIEPLTPPDCSLTLTGTFSRASAHENESHSAPAAYIPPDWGSLLNSHDPHKETWASLPPTSACLVSLSER